jgi:toxin ParE1/3/4
MARVRLSAPAQADLGDILTTSLERWGAGGRSRYAALIAAAIRAIAAEPTGPTTRARDELLPGICSFHVRHARRDQGVKAPVHVVYYRRVRSDLIEVVRVLHERMDPSRQFEGPSRASSKPRRHRRTKAI